MFKATLATYRYEGSTVEALIRVTTPAPSHDAVHLRLQRVHLVLQGVLGTLEVVHPDREVAHLVAHLRRAGG